MSPDHLGWDLDLEIKDFPYIVSPLLGNNSYRSVYGGEGFLPENTFVFYNSFVMSNSTFNPAIQIDMAKKFLRGGPRKHIFFHPNKERACIVSAGALVPGANTLLRELVMSLYYNYGLKDIVGLKYGFNGMNEKLVKLNPETTKNIHNFGGNILGTTGNSDYSDLDIQDFIDMLVEKQVSMLFVIGGLAEMVVLNRIYKEIKKKMIKIVCCGVPSTTDKEFPIFDSTPGFSSAVEGAQQCISIGAVEARSTEYGLSIIKLNGKNSGYAAVYSALSSRDVDICIVPEFNFELYGDTGLLSYIY